MAKSHILKDLINALDLSISAFEREIGVSNGTVGKAIDRDAEISPLVLKNISKKYPKVRSEWLETGKGAIMNEEATEETLSPGEIKLSGNKEIITFGKTIYRRLAADEYSEAFRDWLGVPMYNVPVTASFVQTYRDTGAMHPQYYLHDPRFKDCSFGAIITGDSMYSEIRHGDFVVCQEIIDKDFVVFGDIYYVVSTNGLETCKYLNADPNNPDNYMLVPRNDSISPSPIPKKMIQRLFKVRGVVRGY